MTTTTFTDDCRLLSFDVDPVFKVEEEAPIGAAEVPDHRHTPNTVVPEKYIFRMHRIRPPLPAVTWKNWYKELKYLNVFILTATPVVGFLGARSTPLRWETFLFSVLWYFVTGLGITAGCHRLWSHKSYRASLCLQYFLALGSAGALEGSIKKWAKDHRAHHRYIDTDLDPYNAHRSLLWSHLGWMVVQPRRQPGAVDISDLNRDDVVQWQHRNYTSLALLVAFVIPAVVAWWFWDDARGGFVYAGVLRTCLVHHSTFCVNSLAHYLGEATFGDDHSPRDHFVTALLTIGEGYHNFHHQFPIDYRSATKWYQYDPTKWFIWSCAKLGLASHLMVFPENEVRKSHFTMNLKKLLHVQESIEWPTKNLPAVTWKSFQEESKTRKLILISGFIHDVSDFIEVHPGGATHLLEMVGKDATVAFNGFVHEHTNVAHAILAMKRVGVLIGGCAHVSEDNFVPPSPSTSPPPPPTPTPTSRRQLKICKVT